MQVGFIGLGFLGTKIARGIVEGGFDTVVYDVNPEALESFTERNVTIASSIAEVAKGSEIVEVCVINDAQVDEVVAGPDGLLKTPMQTGSIIVIHSTISPATCRRLSEQAAAVGVSLVDAALTSNVDRNTRVVLVGGDADVFERCLPVFESFATREKITLVGPVGSGEVVKIVNNFLLFANMGSATAALELGERLGVPGEFMESTLMNGSGTSQGIKTLLTPINDRSSLIRMGTKDVNLAIDVAALAGIEVRELAQAAQEGLAAMQARISK